MRNSPVGRHRPRWRIQICRWLAWHHHLAWRHHHCRRRITSSPSPTLRAPLPLPPHEPTRRLRVGPPSMRSTTPSS
ncbi:hypothetical protein LINPERPRIM_LOCUS43547 [Linum perenne]